MYVSSNASQFIAGRQTPAATNIAMVRPIFITSPTTQLAAEIRVLKRNANKAAGIQPMAPPVKADSTALPGLLANAPNSTAIVTDNAICACTTLNGVIRIERFI